MLVILIWDDDIAMSVDVFDPLNSPAILLGVKTLEFPSCSLPCAILRGGFDVTQQTVGPVTLRFL